MIYGFMDLLGDLGGVLEIILITFGFFMNNISEHSFYTNSISKLYMANTKDEKLFGKKIKKVNSIENDTGLSNQGKSVLTNLFGSLKSSVNKAYT